MMPIKQSIKNARSIDNNQLQTIIINQEKIIEQILPQKNEFRPEENPSIDLQGDWISLGGLDLQINGGLGLAFTDLEEKDCHKLEEICTYLWHQGIDAFIPTIVTTSKDKINKSLTTIAQFIAQNKDKTSTAKILGTHLEGPFLNPTKRGAHPEEYLLSLTIENLKEVVNKYQKTIKIVTLASELDSTGATISYLKSQGIIVSLGHSLATEEEARQAFKLGASMVTHAFNAMPSLHHRQSGLLGSAIINPDVYCGLIADGNHVNKTMMKILLKASEFDQGIFLVSDALAPIGLAEGIYPWDNRKIEVKEGTARLTDGTLAGTTLPLLAGVQNLVRWQICPPEKAIAMATESPRKAIHLPGLVVGQEANLLRWSWNEQENNLTWQRIPLTND